VWRDKKSREIYFYERNYVFRRLLFSALFLLRAKFLEEVESLIEK